MRVFLNNKVMIKYIGCFFLGIVVIGVILFVVSQRNDLADSVAIDSDKHCEKVSSLSCWEDIMRTVLAKKGLGAAFGIVEQQYATNPLFAENCHAFVHMIGEAAFQRFYNQEAFTVDGRSTYCSYGFYHGFMETLFQETGSLKEAKTFCAYLDEQFSGEVKEVGSQCFHGIGHGVVDLHDPRMEGDAEKMAVFAMQTCVDVADSNEHLHDCATGVFNGIANYFTAGEYGLTLDKENPLWLCKKQDPEFQNTCYGFMARVLYALDEKNSIQAIRRAEKLVGEPHLYTIVSNITALDAGRILEQDTAEYKAPCKTLVGSLRLACVEGYATGLVQQGRPGEEYKRALAFCEDDASKPEEKTICYTTVIGLIVSLYTPEKMQTVCETVDQRYKKECLL